MEKNRNGLKNTISDRKAKELKSNQNIIQVSVHITFAWWSDLL